MQDMNGDIHPTTPVDEEESFVKIPRRERDATPYYEALNRACDAVVRCNDCRKLLTAAQINANRGVTPCCGTRKVREARTLSLWEWFKVRTGIMDFPYRKEFLKEFGRGRA